MPRTIRATMALASVCVLLAGCRGGDSAGRDSGGRESGPGSHPPMQQPNPVEVTVSKDADRLASSTIEAATGGVLTTTAADGTVLTLSIPAGALLGDETIFLTPVAAIDGLPLEGGMVGAAHLEPTGLRLISPATLTIRPPAALDPARIIAFGYAGEGSELYLHPHGMDTTGISLAIMHFSGYGAGDGTAADRTEMERRPPASAQNRAMQEIEKAVHESRSRGRTAPDAKEMERILREWYETSIKPNLKAAESDDGRFMCAVAEWRNWMEVLALLPTNPLTRAVDESLASIARGAKNAMDRSYERCTSRNAPEQAGTMAHVQKIADLMSLEERGYPYTTGDLSDRLSKCLRFEVTFDSRIDYVFRGFGPVERQSRYTSTAIAEWSADAGEGFKSDRTPAALTEEWSDPTSDPSEWTDTFSSRFTVDRLTISGLQETSLVCGGNGGNEGGKNRDVTLFYTVTFPSGSGSGSGAVGGFWYMDYSMFFHPHEEVPLLQEDEEDACSYASTDFRNGEGPVVAEKIYSRIDNDPGFSVLMSEETRITIRHAPRE